MTPPSPHLPRPAVAHAESVRNADVLALRRGELTAVVLAQRALDRVAVLDPAVASVVVTDSAGAMVAAHAADVRRTSGDSLSPLDGVPVLVKDNIHVAGLPTTAGSAILRGYRPPVDASCVARLRALGAVVIGKTNLDEFGMGSATSHSVHGVTRNPWDTARSPGGSSGGSAAAVALGVAPLALGTDTGGSVRQPAAHCGVVGLKPTYGRISRHGVVAYASSLDQVGVLGDDLAMSYLLLAELCGACPNDGTTATRPPPAPVPVLPEHTAPLRIGVPRALLGAAEQAVDPAVQAALDKALVRLAEAGHTIVDVELPHTHLAVDAYYVIATAEASSNLARYDGVRYGPRPEVAPASLDALLEGARGLFGAEVRRRILLGTFVLSAGCVEAYLRTAQRVRRCIAEDFRAAFSHCDAIVLPCAPTPAPLHDASADPLSIWLQDLFTVPASLAGLPAFAVPVGLAPPTPTAPPLPIGLQLVGRPFDEQTLYAVARLLAVKLYPPLLPATAPSPLPTPATAGA